MKTYPFMTRNLGCAFRRITQYISVILAYTPSVFLLSLFALSLIILPQGADLMVKTMESSQGFPGLWVLLSLFFWSYMLWYSGRMISYCKEKLYRQSSRLMFHIPRLLGFSVYSILGLALFICTARPGLYEGSTLLGLLLIGIPLQYSLSYLFLRGICKWVYRHSGQKGLDILFRNAGLSSILIILSTLAWNPGRTGMLMIAGLLQLLFSLVVMIRKRVTETRMPLRWKNRAEQILHLIFRSMKQRIPEREAHSFLVLQCLSLISLITFLLCIVLLPFSLALGSLTILMLAFGFYTGLSNLIWVLAHVYRINIIFFLLLIALGGAQLNNAHRIQTVPVKGLDYTLRPDFKTYIYAWLSHHEAAICSPHTKIVPMIFVHSDGGASRSAYWVAGVLSHLDSLSEHQFSDHLFALSGASGGSLGNTTYYSLLYLRRQQARNLPMQEEAAGFLKTDFLSYSLARMLGADPVNYIYPVLPDRARALEQSMEAGGLPDSELYGFFSRPFSTLWIDTNNKQFLMPVLCINTTRMQDGQPAVISNVQLSHLAFAKRLDVLSLLAPDEDIRISTAVVLGARFPYISPAGSILQQSQAHQQEHYFVDGGYFDNSGAGIVQEMILEIEDLFRYDRYLQQRYGPALKKIRYQVLHISNSPGSAPRLNRINTMVNDLAAPFITLVGSYSAQTSVNDFRLQAYVMALQKSAARTALYPSYQEINLYLDDSLQQHEYYSMNWVLSESSLNRMQQRLYTHSDIQQFAHYLRLHTAAPNNTITSSIHK